MGRFAIKKVDGDRNPADLLTKHSLSREKLMNLTKIHGLCFMGGRPSAAPATRTTPSMRVTMASADGAGDISAVINNSEVIMPHTVLCTEDLNQEYPDMVVAEDVGDADLDRDSDDYFAQIGERIASEILEAARLHGRRRRMDETERMVGSEQKLSA